MTTTKTTTIDQAADDERRRSAIRRLDAHELKISQSAVGVARGETVTVGQAAVGMVLADGDVSMSQGGGRLFVVGGDLHLRQGGGGLMVAGGDVDIREGGVGTMVALGGVRIERGGSAIALTRRVEVGEGAYLGIALAPSVTVMPGGRLLAGLREVAAAGAIAGLVVGFVVVAARRLTGR